MDELRRTQVESTMAQPEFSRSIAGIDHSQVWLPRLLDTNEISQPPHERMTKLEAAMAELKRVHAECATSQVQFMESIRANVQIQPAPFQSLKKETTQKATSYTQLGFEKEQPKEEESMSIEELVAKYLKEQENMAIMSFEGQHKSSPSTLGVNIEEETLRHNEEITSRDNEELKKFQTMENDAQILETLVVKEDEPTSPESHEKTNDEVVRTIPEMTLWVPMHEEVKNENKTPTSKVDEYIIHLNNELKGIIVKKKK